MVQHKLAYADVNGRKCRQSSTMLNFQGEHKLMPAFQPIRKAAWWHQAITWTNVDLSSDKSHDIHLRALS